MVKPRVVLIPGLMGSVLRDGTRPSDQLQKLCAKHWEMYPRLRDFLTARGNTLCGSDSDAIWGVLPFLHWLADIPGWLGLLTRGDGYQTPDGILPKGVTDFVLRNNKKVLVDFRPYAPLIERLKQSGYQVLVFPYDWRLRLNEAGFSLQKAIVSEFWNSKLPQGKLDPEEKVVLIGHSMGGLLARLFVEDQSLAGHALVRRAIMIGTPHMGAPVAYAYLSGTNSIFGDSVVWNTLRKIHDQQPRETKPDTADPDFQAWHSRDMDIAMLTGDEEKQLVQSFASICQLLPSYDFMEVKGKPGAKEKYQDTYKHNMHAKAQKQVLEILQELTNRLRAPSALQSWLQSHSIQYDLIGSIGRPTVIGMRPAASKSHYATVTARQGGDGTVPTYSALGWAKENKDLTRVETFEVSPGSKYAVHAELCRNRQVIDHCIARVRPEPKSLITARSSGGRMERANLDHYLKVARHLFLNPASPVRRKSKQTQVVSFALLHGRDAKSPLIDITTHFDMHGNERLTNPPAGIMKDAMVFSDSVDGLSFRYVTLVGIPTGIGGVLFMPEKDEGWLHVFGVITTQWEERLNNDGRLTNRGHAEMQFLNWFQEQRSNREFAANLWSLFMWNDNLNHKDHSRRPKKCDHSDNWGFSPCAACSEELAHMWWPENIGPRMISWTTLYKGRQGDNATTAYSINSLTEKTWLVCGCMPPGVKGAKNPNNEVVCVP